MPTAIQLTRANIDLISGELGIDKESVKDEWEREVLRSISSNPSPIYYVKDVLYMSTRMPYLIYTHQEFLNDFASIPPGIEERFIPVTQVKADS
jgi:hypothetical protein